MKTAIFVTVLCSSLFGVFAANTTTVKYDPKEGDDSPIVDVSVPAGAVKCYDCSFFRRGSNLEGNQHCKWDEDSDVGQVPTDICNGYCVKDWLVQNALTPYLYVSRYCASECTAGTYARYEKNMVRTCCKDELCNSATGLRVTLGAIVLSVISLVMKLL